MFWTSVNVFCFLLYLITPGMMCLCFFVLGLAFILLLSCEKLPESAVKAHSQRATSLALSMPNIRAGSAEQSVFGGKLSCNKLFSSIFWHYIHAPIIVLWFKYLLDSCYFWNIFLAQGLVEKICLVSFTWLSCLFLWLFGGCIFLILVFQLHSTPQCNDTVCVQKYCVCWVCLGLSVTLFNDLGCIEHSKRSSAHGRGCSGASPSVQCYSTDITGNLLCAENSAEAQGKELGMNVLSLVI